MPDIKFGINLLPNTNEGYDLGSSSLKWNIFGNLTGNASTATKWASTQSFTIKDSDATNTGDSTNVDGSTAVILKLPSTIKATLTGNASTATKLETAREIYVDLGTTRNSNSQVTFDGSADKTIHISGILLPKHGGTGLDSYSKGDILYAGAAISNSDTTTLSKLSITNSDVGKVLFVNSDLPDWYDGLTLAIDTTGNDPVYSAIFENDVTADTFIGDLNGNASTATSSPRLSIIDENTEGTDTNLFSTAGLNVRWYNTASKFSGQPSQWGFLFTAGTTAGGNEVHQFWAAQANSDLYHRGTNTSSHEAPPAFKMIIDSSNWYKQIFANKNKTLSTLTVFDSTWAVIPSGSTDVFGLSFKDTGLTYTPSGGTATASSDTGDWRAWLTCAADSNSVTLNMRIDGWWYATKFVGPLQGNADTATALTGGLTTNDVTTHGNLKVTTAKGSYYGINLGGNAGGMTIMSINASHQGLFNQANGQWILYYNAASTSKSIVIGNTTINVTGGISLNLNTKVTGTLGITGATDMNGDLNLYTTSADSPDITWWYANKGKEQARIWMGSGGDTKFAPNYRCYKSDGTSLYSGKLVIGDGTGASGTWGISVTGSSASCTGNAATASKLTNFTSSDAASSSSTYRYVWISYIDNTTGRPTYDTNFAYRTDTGTLKVGRISCHPSAGTNSYNEGLRVHVTSSGWATILLCGSDNTGDTGTSTNSWGIFNYNGTLYINRATSSGAGASRAYANSNGWYFDKAYGSVWNDFAEYRQSVINEPGRVIIPGPNGVAYLSTERLQAGGRIISDTFGFAVGASDRAKTPVGLSGRVLAYPYQNINNYKIGDCVCTAPNGTVDIMTREEIKEYPDRIIGIVNEIPTYDIWQETLKCPGGEPSTSNIKVDGRIWIDIK